MTLIVGIKCSNGIVVATDRQTTHGVSGAPTVGHQTSKVHVIKQKALLASSGHRGFSQQVAFAIDSLVDGFERQKSSDSVANVQREYRKLLAPAAETAKLMAPLIGAQNAQSDIVCHSMLIAKFITGSALVEITPIGGVEFLSTDLPYLCLGSGKQNADPILGFLWSIYFADGSTPTMNEGALLAYWTVLNAIKLASYGVGYGVDVHVFDPSKNPPIYQLSQEELREHSGFIGEAEAALRSVREAIARGGTQQPPTMQA